MTGQVWFITGSSRGLGRSVAEEALAAGRRVVATARRTSTLDHLAERYRGRLLDVPLDVTDPAQASGAVGRAVEQFGRLDVVVNNAGYADLAPGRGGLAGRAIDIIGWQTGTARLLPRLLKGRKSGPLFVTERKARVQLPAADLDERGRARLSYQQAEALFSEASGGATLHQLRHSALTHDAGDGTGTPMLMARSGHTSVRSLAKYARVSAEALARHQAERDPARRQ